MPYEIIENLMKTEYDKIYLTHTKIITHTKNIKFTS